MFYHSTEFYFTDQKNISEKEIILERDESYHATTVMRHSIHDNLYVTDGKGSVYNCRIKNISKNQTILTIESKSFQKNKLKDIVFLIPVLKSNNRLEFAIEKSVELGITNISIYSSGAGSRKRIKLERLNKISKAAMKQSLRAYKPKLNHIKSFSEIPQHEIKFILFDQLAEEKFTSATKLSNERTFFIFGPEAGLLKSEIDLIKNKDVFKLSESRLRTETAVVAAASILSAM